jgi:arabinosyltransferase C
VTEAEVAANHRSIQRFTLLLAGGAGLFALLPVLFALMAAPPGSVLLGYPYNADDHMVYAAWMRQAMDGRFLFDNRFTTEVQPGLTLHVYYLVLGWVARVTGILWAVTLARVGFTVLFVILLSRFVSRLNLDPFIHKLGLSLVVVGGGIGFTVWHTFGQEIVRPAPEFLRTLMLGRLPTDVWQPEGFVLPSLLTNSLFMVSLCLIVYVLDAFLEAESSWKPVLPGAVAFGVLMNIHSYDVLLVALVMVGFLAMAFSAGTVRGAWVARALAIGAGALPAALWFVYVLRNDPVFQSRAATETFSPNFRQVFFGYLPMMLLAIAGLFLQPKDVDERGKKLMGAGLFTVLIAGMFLAAVNHPGGYFMDPTTWVLVFLLTLGALYLMADKSPAMNLIVAWAVIGVVAIYFPALFQRKLAMGLGIPWALLAAFGIAALLRNQERSARNLATVLVIVVFSATSLRWLVRDVQLIQNNVSNTTVHPVYLSPDMVRIVEYLNRRPVPGAEGRVVVVAMPGQPAAILDPQSGQPLVDERATPLVPDLNPIVSGLTGAYTYAGHWSETPDYNQRRGKLDRMFLGDVSAEERRAILTDTNASHVIAPVPEAFPGSNLFDFQVFGSVVVEGRQFRLIQVSREQ